MASFNRLLLLGNLTRDPETRTVGGTTICGFSLGTNRQWTDAQGRKQTEVTFVPVVAFGKQAETLGKFLVKGKPLFVEGRLKLEEWKNDQGEKRSRLVCILEDFKFIDGGHPKASPGPIGPTSEEDYHGRGD